MDDLTLKEELQILNAAKLAGEKAPEELNSRRAREFVANNLRQNRSHRWTFFSSPMTYMAFAIAACVIAVLVVFRPVPGVQYEVMQQDKIHATADSLDCSADTLDVDGAECFELTSIDE